MREVIYDEYNAVDPAIADAFNDYLSQYEFNLAEAIEREVLEAEEALRLVLSVLDKTENKLVPAIIEVIRIYNCLEDDVNRSRWEEILYEQSCAILLDDNGAFPDLLEWGYTENRPLIRSMFGKAEDLWIAGDVQAAQTIYEGLLKGNPGDHPGVRYNLLGILEGMTFEKFSALAYEDDHMSKMVDPWFFMSAPKHKEFEAMFKAWNEMAL